MTTILVLGVLVGAILGLTGAGGGIFAVPALVFGLHWSVTQASPVGLMAVAGAAAVGSIEGFRRGLVRYKAATLMAVTGVTMTSLGMRAARGLPESLLLTLFAAAMFIVAYRLFRSSLTTPSGSAGANGRRRCACRMDPGTGRLHWTPLTALALSLVGLVSGFLTGLLGVGGGFVIVPALRQISDISMHGIVATSLMVIAIVAGGAVLVAWMHGAELHPAVAAPFVGATAIGMIAGRLLVHRLPESLLQRGFAGMMGLVAVSLVIKAFHP